MLPHSPHTWTLVSLLLTALALPSLTCTTFPSLSQCVQLGGFVCSGDSSCLPPSLVCDGSPNCWDGSDEDPAFCSAYNCTQGGYNRVKCPGDDTRCLSQSSFCDGVVDCPNAADESNSLCKNYNCSSLGKVACPSLIGCIDVSELCDGKTQCLDQSDESFYFCRYYFNCSSANKTTCPSGKGCMDSAANVCDGAVDCLDGSDESNATCSSGFDCAATGRTACPSGAGCVASDRLLCDGQQDCADGSDEGAAFCNNTAFNCSATGRVACPSGVGCVSSSSRLCDGVRDCSDGSDESASLCSKSFNCSATGRATCPSGAVCSSSGSGSGSSPVFCRQGPPSCPDGSDQQRHFCRRYTCPAGYRKCRDGVTCVAEGVFCDGQKQCPDGSDEDPSTCKGFDCAATSRYSCPSGTGCMTDSCDICSMLGRNVSFCLDGSDQDPRNCGMRPSPSVCSARNPHMGSCSNPQAQGPAAAPASPPPSAHLPSAPPPSTPIPAAPGPFSSTPSTGSLPPKGANVNGYSASPGPAPVHQSGPTPGPSPSPSPTGALAPHPKPPTNGSGVAASPAAEGPSSNGSSSSAAQGQQVLRTASGKSGAIVRLYKALHKLDVALSVFQEKARAARLKGATTSEQMSHAKTAARKVRADIQQGVVAVLTGQLNSDAVSLQTYLKQASGEAAENSWKKALSDLSNAIDSAFPAMHHFLIESNGGTGR